MLKKTGLALLLLAATAAQAHAEYQCSVKPQDDVIISPQSVQVKGASGDLQISPDGDVIRNGQALSLSDSQRQKAFSYQSALRKQLPWIDDGAQKHLEKARAALDKVIVKELGSNSNVRNRLTTLNGQLKQQMNRIIEHRSDGLTFHHKAIDQVEQDGRNIVQQSMGGVLQDSLNEMGVKQAATAAAIRCRRSWATWAACRRRSRTSGTTRSRTSRTSVATFATASPHWKPSARIC